MYQVVGDAAADQLTTTTTTTTAASPLPLLQQQSFSTHSLPWPLTTESFAPPSLQTELILAEKKMPNGHLESTGERKSRERRARACVSCRCSRCVHMSLRLKSTGEPMRVPVRSDWDGNWAQAPLSHSARLPNVCPVRSPSRNDSPPLERRPQRLIPSSFYLRISGKATAFRGCAEAKDDCESRTLLLWRGEKLVGTGCTKCHSRTLLCQVSVY